MKSWVRVLAGAVVLLGGPLLGCVTSRPEGKVKTVAKEVVPQVPIECTQSRSSIRADEAVVMTVRADFSSEVTFEWSTDAGSVRGKGTRVTLIPERDFSGPCTVSFTAKKGSSVVAQHRFEVDVKPGPPELVIERVIKEDAGRVIVRGRVTNLENPEDYRIVAYIHADVYYKLRGRHVFKLNHRGKFAFMTDVRPEVDRMVVHLISKKFNPDGPGGCQNPWKRVPGLCTGHFDDYYQTHTRLPLKIDGKRAFAFATHHFLDDVKHPDPQIQNLLRRFTRVPVTGAPRSAAFVRSYLTTDQIYLYDQALAVLAFARAGLQDAAKRVLDAMAHLQIVDGTTKDGSWYFSYDPDGTSIYPNEPSFKADGTPDGHTYGDRRVAGAICWMAMALNAYRMRFEDPTYDEAWHRVMEYISREMEPAVYHGVHFRGVRFQPTDLSRTRWDESSVLSVEHNLDAYSAFRVYAKMTGNARYSERALEIRRFLESMWIAEERRFYPGYNLGEDGPNRGDLYKDPQTWGLLALGHDRSSLERFGDGLTFVCEQFLEPAGYIRGGDKVFVGFFDWRPQQAGPDYEARRFVWTEGTLSTVMAMSLLKAKTGKEIQCTSHGRTYRAKDFLDSMNQIQDRDGGVPYATMNDLRDDFSIESSVAGTAWLYFANQGFNPFDPEFPKEDL